MATQLQLANISENLDFQRRIHYLMVKAAIAKLNATNPPTADIILGQKILNNLALIHQWALAALQNPTIAAGAHAQDGSTILENDLEFVVNSLWLAFSL